MSNLKNCGCGDKPESDSVLSFRVEHKDPWEVGCPKCGIFVYAPTQEQAETLWNDARSAGELSVRIAEIEAQEKAMRNCMNCRNKRGQDFLDHYPCFDCDDHTINHWQPRPAIKEG